jgi:aspartyl-tRNA(Asn)/glutamyl-tRNA(Gln) amidotransferase subunit A
MARTVEDVALLLQALAGYDPDEPLSVNQPADDYLSELKGGVSGWRVAIARRGFDDANPEILAAVAGATKVFEQLGAQIEAVDLSYCRETRPASFMVMTNDADAYHYERLQSRPQDFGADVLKRLQNGLKAFDLLLAPTVPMAAPRLDDSAEIEWARANLSVYTLPFNAAGVPALSLPCGFTKNNLPIGLQIVGRAWNEAGVLRAAYAYEQATDWHTRRPALA